MIRNIFNCVSIHNGGGLTYLSLMHSEIDKKDNLVLLDSRIKNKLKAFEKADIRFLKKNLLRNIQILFLRTKYTIIFTKYLSESKTKDFICEYYLNGLPPLFRFPISTNRVFILFQNRNLFSYLNYFSNKFYFNLRFIIYHLIHSFLINSSLKNTDTLIVQTNSMRNLISSLKPNNNIIINDIYWKNITIKNITKHKIDFFSNSDKRSINIIKDISKTNILFFYPAYLDPHKNHKILFNCFNKLSNNGFSNLYLIVTLFPNQVSSKIVRNKQIIFLGNQSFQNILNIYKLVDYLIFPSLNESLGLPLIEASLHKLPIIASDLDFVYDVCEPLYTFNPYSEKDIYYKILELTS